MCIRDRGYSALWLPGTDHAGIATQIKVEEELRVNEGKTRYDLGREKFLSLIHIWPYGGRFVTQRVIDTIRLTLKLPGCSKKFPRDLGKERPCRNYHMNNCDAWCQLSRSPAEYRARMEQAMLLLPGKSTELADSLREKQLAAAEGLDFEQAAMLRDRLRAVESLGQKQLVTAGSMANTDVIGYYQSEAKACFAVLHYCLLYTSRCV